MYGKKEAWPIKTSSQRGMLQVDQVSIRSYTALRKIHSVGHGCSSSNNRITEFHATEFRLLEPRTKSNKVLQSQSRLQDREWLPTRKRPAHKIDIRNGRPCLSPGDKCYKKAEYSTNFFKDWLEPRCAPIQFNEKSTIKVPYSHYVKNKAAKRLERKKKEHEDEVLSVIKLNSWAPSNSVKMYKSLFA
ncbi:spermatogenesis-associated serine-rich protein 1-like [Argonauta hians]